MSSNILIMIKYDDNLGKFMPTNMFLVPRTSLFLSIYLFIHNYILKFHEGEKYNINLTHNNNDILWFLPIGVYFDCIDNKYIELICRKIPKFDKYDIFDIPITKNKNLMIQQRLKHGLGTIFNTTKFFMDLNVQEVEKYISFTLSINDDDHYGLEKNFYSILDKLYGKKNIAIKFPLVIHVKDKINFFAPEMKNQETSNETLKDIIWRCGIDVDILEKNKNIIINGLSFDCWKNIPVVWAIKYMCSCDLFIHVIIRN